MRRPNRSGAPNHRGACRWAVGSGLGRAYGMRLAARSNGFRGLWRVCQRLISRLPGHSDLSLPSCILRRTGCVLREADILVKAMLCDIDGTLVESNWLHARRGETHSPAPVSRWAWRMYSGRLDREAMSLSRCACPGGGARPSKIRGRAIASGVRRSFMTPGASKYI